MIESGWIALELVEKQLLELLVNKSSTHVAGNGEILDVAPSLHDYAKDGCVHSYKSKSWRMHNRS